MLPTSLRCKADRHVSPATIQGSMSRQTDFIRNEFWILSWNALVQRAVSYRRDSTEKEHSEFRHYMIDHCERAVLPAYRSALSEEEHITNIVSLCDAAQSYADQSLLARPYNIGAAQKLLNLQLKYLWCVDLIPMPPHCPIDRIVLGHTRLRSCMNWTEISEVAGYRYAIEAIRETAGDRPLARWST